MKKEIDEEEISEQSKMRTESSLHQSYDNEYDNKNYTIPTTSFDKYCNDDLRDNNMVLNLPSNSQMKVESHKIKRKISNLEVNDNRYGKIQKLFKKSETTTIKNDPEEFNSDGGPLKYASNSQRNNIFERKNQVFTESNQKKKNALILKGKEIMTSNNETIISNLQQKEKITSDMEINSLNLFISINEPKDSLIETKTNHIEIMSNYSHIGKVEASNLRYPGPRTRISHVPSFETIKTQRSLQGLQNYQSKNAARESQLKAAWNKIPPSTIFNIDQKKAKEEESRAKLTILNWDPSWLNLPEKSLAPVWKQENISLTDTEYKQAIDTKEPGEIVQGFNKPIPYDMKKPKGIDGKFTYDSFHSYNLMMQPTMYTYMWNLLCNNYRKSTTQNHILAKVKCNKETDVLKRSIEVTLDISIIQNPNIKCPETGDFVILILTSNQNGDQRAGASHTSLDCFGYVNKSRILTPIHQRDAYGKTEYVYKYEVDLMLKAQNHAIKPFETVKIVPIKEIGDHFSKLKGLFELSNTPLSNVILQPNYRSMTRPSWIHNNKKFVEKCQHYMNELHDQLENILPVSNKQKNIMESITKTLSCKESSVNLIEGLPGTGKTRTLVRTVLSLRSEMLLRDPRQVFHERILVCVSSNEALNEFTIQIHQAQKYILGEKVYDLNMVVLQAPNGYIHPDIEKYTLKERAKLSSLDRRYEDILIHAELLIIDYEAITNPHFQQACPSRMSFPICIIDDAQNYSELHSLLPLMYHAKKIVLSGDNSLPLPLIKDARDLGFNNTSLFTRISRSLNAEITHRKKSLVTSDDNMTLQHFKYENLDEITYHCLTSHQMRMSEELMTVAKNTFPLFKLQSNDNNKKRNPLPFKPFVIFEHGLLNRTDENGYTRTWLQEEAKIVVKLVRGIEHKVQIHKQKVKLLVITGESSHASLIKTMFQLYFNSMQHYRNQNGITQVDYVSTSVLEVKDALAAEADIVILCLGQAENSDLKESRYLNLALTRAKESLIIIGNLEYFTKTGTREWNALLQSSQEQKAHLLFNCNTKIEDMYGFLLQPKQIKLTENKNRF